MKLLLPILTIALLASSVFYWRAQRYDERAVLAPLESGTATAYFAGGCFWCTESDFEKLTGVSAVISGYAGGTTTDPTYTSVSSHTTGHLEAVEVRYDPSIVSYETLIRYFFSHIDPTDPTGQFVDQGDSYLSAVFYQSETEKMIGEAEIKRLTDSGAYDRPLVTTLRPFTVFYPAEEYHQDYSTKNPARYHYYRGASGRDQYLERICPIRATKNVPCLKAE
ncbi:MAG: peptide-methionine (S)-S-oxide reductase MsrA [Candidatus Moraniibacteriota bacterium]|nr:MAG: peptide-methionine (S)-S-oxide reductase MsrA [Candidatus Moranbacteria bacterium]